MDSQNEVLVTICTPCYNHEEYLEDYLQSLMEQTYNNIELVIVDDCSTDNSAKVIESHLPRLKKRFKRVVFKRNKENLGITKTCNIAFKEAWGDLIKPVASDDVLPKWGIEKLVNYMFVHKDAKIVIGNAIQVNDDYKYGENVYGKKLINVDKMDNICNMHDKLLNGNFIPSVGVMYTKELLLKYGVYDENLLYEDWDYFLTISKKEHIFWDEDVVYYYRKSKTSFGEFRSQIDKKERAKRFLRMYRGGKQVLVKHTGSIEVERRNRYLNQFELSQLLEATKNNIEEGIEEVTWDLYKLKCTMNKKEKVKFWIIRNCPTIILNLIWKN